jgi:hypothetical protein
MNKDFRLEAERPEQVEARKKGWDEEFDRPVAQCAVEEMIWEELAAKEAEGDENEKADSTHAAAARRSIAGLVNDAG